jgi:class 3 adenylate cyclase
MALLDDLKAETAAIFGESWSKRDGTVVPETEALNLTNDAVELEGTVLYADLSDSTSLVNTSQACFAAEIYKAYLHCAAKIVRSDGGTITAYDGDRIMAVFIGNAKNTAAVRAALKINFARLHIINPAIKSQYSTNTYELHHTVGIDTSKLFVARTGVRGANDLVWVGRAANYAAKLTDLSSDYPTRITGEIFDNMHESVKTSQQGRIWEERQWSNMNNLRIYRSAWMWRF